jgi:hypothetical protein
MKKRWYLIHDFIILLEKWRFHVDKFHLKPKNIKNHEHFTKVSKNTGTIPLYRCINKSRYFHIFETIYLNCYKT